MEQPINVLGQSPMRQGSHGATADTDIWNNFEFHNCHHWQFHIMILNCAGTPAGAKRPLLPHDFMKGLSVIAGPSQRILLRPF
jgi:hypothetical protein